MNRYRAHGLRIDSALPLPLRPADDRGEPDLRIQHAGPSAALGPTGPDRRSLLARPDGWTLRYDNSRGGWMAFDHSAPERCIAVSGSVGWGQCAGPLAGVVCGVHLRLRGGTPLHAAGLSLGGRAFAVLGVSGAGKSTMAAALLARGAGLLSEDLLALSPGKSGFSAEPGATTLGLLPDAEAAFGKSLGRACNARDGKMEFEIGDASAAEALPLAALFVLAPHAPRAGPGMEKLSTLAGTAELMQHLYGASWIRPPDDADLKFCSSLARAVPLFKLLAPSGLDQVPATADLLCGKIEEVASATWRNEAR